MDLSADSEAFKSDFTDVQADRDGMRVICMTWLVYSLSLLFELKVITELSIFVERGPGNNAFQLEHAFSRFFYPFKKYELFIAFFSFIKFTMHSLYATYTDE